MFQFILHFAELCANSGDLKPGDQVGYCKFKIIYFFISGNLTIEYLLHMGQFGGRWQGLNIFN